MKNSPEKPRLSHRKLLKRADRREAILNSATKAFAQSGFEATSLDDVAREAGVTRMILYRHFESKRKLYEAILEHFRNKLTTAVKGLPQGAIGSYSQFIQAFVSLAAENPDGFRLYYQHVAREPEFHDYVEKMNDAIKTRVEENPVMRQILPDPQLRAWASETIYAVIIQSIIAWLNAGKPNATKVSEAIRQIIVAAMQAIKSTQTDSQPNSSEVKSR